MDNKDSQETYREQLDTLRTRYLEKLPEKLDRLESLVFAIPVDGFYREDNGNVQSQLNLVYQEAHSLAGSAGTLGLGRISEEAQKLQSIIDRWFDHSSADPVLQRDTMLQLVQGMRQGDVATSSDVPTLPGRGTGKIHLVEDNEPDADQMLSWLRDAGFDTELFMSASVYGDTFEVLPRPDLIIMDVHFGNDVSAGTRIIHFLSQKLGRLPPVAFLSAQSDMKSRLAALRAGATQYLTKPISRENLLQLADEHVQRKDSPALRVLMVDDEESVLEANRLTLEHAGLKVRSVSDPFETLEAAHEFDPDVIMLDMLMPEISGSELASVLRQDWQFDAVPIVFLTTESSPDQKVIGTALGGDDFITKPCEQDYLLTSLIARARRSRRLREQMNRNRRL
ncbi:MAG: response regulator [Gammaproteobacteria bacterium]|nr:MAG: response regulator [Gammaproteobacteria bacterium]